MSATNDYIFQDDKLILRKDSENNYTVTLKDKIPNYGSLAKLLKDLEKEHCNGKNITSAVISDGVTSIGDSVFNNCTNLKSIVIPDSVTSIGDRAFSGCKSLKSIVIPYGVTSIDASAFKGCSEELTIYVSNMDGKEINNNQIIETFKRNNPNIQGDNVKILLASYNKDARTSNNSGRSSTPLLSTSCGGTCWCWRWRWRQLVVPKSLEMS